MESAERLAVPVSEEIAARVQALADLYGVPKAQIAARWMATMPANWQPFATAKKGKGR